MIRCVIGGAVVMSSPIAAAIALARAMHNPRWRNSIRQFNRRTLNPLTLRMAGNRLRIYAALQHTGRRSGRRYTTPVVAEPLGDGFVIPLPYGNDVDWYRNVMAAGLCQLTWNGRTYRLDRPELIAPARALSVFPWVQRIIFTGGGIRQYIWLHRAPDGSEMSAKAAASRQAARETRTASREAL
jgi:hypothetical protein